MSISTTNHRRQAGMVSFLVTLIMMMVIILIVIGFTQISTQNRRQALDRQLSNQASYSAESGINDVLDLLKSGSFSTTSLIKNTCKNEGVYSGLSSNLSGDAGASAKYSCVLVKPVVDSLQFQNLQVGQAKVARMHTVNASGTDVAARQITVIWSPYASEGVDYSLANLNAKCKPAGTNFKQIDYKCPYGIIRLDVVKTSGVTLSAVELAKNTVSFFLYPQGGWSWQTDGAYHGDTSTGQAHVKNLDNPYDPSGSFKLGKVGISGAGCNDIWAYCASTISIEGAAVASDYLVRITPLYRSTIAANITASSAGITGTPAGEKLYFADQQVEIDSTGKVNGVLRRIKVRANISGLGAGDVPLGAIESQKSICKTFAATTATGVGFNNSDTCN